jgi:hypothetical protein
MSNKNYTILLTPQVKQTNDMKGGHNREIFMLNVKSMITLLYLKTIIKK